MTTITLEEIADGLRSQLKTACQAARQEAAVADKALRELAAAQEARQAAEDQVERMLLDSEAAHANLTALRDDRRKLQKALAFWMPCIAGEETPAGQRVAAEAHLLVGMPVEDDEPNAQELGWIVMDSEAKLLREERAEAEALAESYRQREETFRALIADDAYCSGFATLGEFRRGLIGWIDEKNSLDEYPEDGESPAIAGGPK